MVYSMQCTVLQYSVCSAHCTIYRSTVYKKDSIRHIQFLALQYNVEHGSQYTALPAFLSVPGSARRCACSAPPAWPWPQRGSLLRPEPCRRPNADGRLGADLISASRHASCGEVSDAPVPAPRPSAPACPRRLRGGTRKKDPCSAVEPR